MFWPELNDEPFRAWAVEFGSTLMGVELEFWYDQFLAKPPAGERADALAPGRGLLGPAARRPGDHVLDAVPRRRSDERLHALHRRRPPRWRAPACERRRGAERPPRVRPRRVACGRLPAEAGRRDVPPQQDTAHDARQHLRHVASHPHAAPQGGRRGGGGRPLPLEDLRQPGHGRAHRPGDDGDRRAPRVRRALEAGRLAIAQAADEVDVRRRPLRRGRRRPSSCCSRHRVAWW